MTNDCKHLVVKTIGEYLEDGNFIPKYQVCTVCGEEVDESDIVKSVAGKGSYAMVSVTVEVHKLYAFQYAFRCARIEVDRKNRLFFGFDERGRLIKAFTEWSNLEVEYFSDENKEEKDE